MLPDNWRITIYNDTGVTIDASKITIKYRGKYLDSNGKLNYGSESSDVASQSGTIADGAYNNGTTVDNGAETNPFVEADVFIQCDLSSNTGTPDGNVEFYLDKSTADTPDFPDDGGGERFCVINFPNAKSDKDRVKTIG